MPSVKQVTGVAIGTVIGVMIAGAIMNAFRSNDLIDFARNGYDV